MSIFREKFNSVFYRLILSYIIIIILTTSFVAITAYLFASNRFNQEVINVNQKMLTHLCNFINKNILEKVEKICVDMMGSYSASNDLLFFSEPEPNISNMQIYNAHKYLKIIATSNSDIINAIHIYYKNANIILSSIAGVKFINKDIEQLSINADWIKKYNQYKTNSFWIPTREVPVNKKVKSSINNLFSYVRVHPFNASYQKMQGLIAIDIKEKILHNLIEQSNYNQYSSIMVIDQKGNIISHSNKDELFNSLDNRLYIQKIINNSKNKNNFIDTVNNIKSMVSYTTLDAGWKLVSITPVNHFYMISTMIQRATIIISITAIVIGLILSFIFTSNIYSPLQNIIGNIKNLFSKDFQLNKINMEQKNEYGLINQTLKNLFSKANHLEETLENNMPLIKNNLVNGLLHHTINTEEEIENRINLLDLSFYNNFYNTVLLELDQELLQNLNPENSHFLKFNIINQIESLSTSKNKFLAVEINDFEIGIIISTNTEEETTIINNLKQVETYTFSNFNLTLSAVIGIWVDKPTSLHHSFKTAQDIKKYRYFYPDKKILKSSVLAKRKEGIKKIPKKLLDSFSTELRTRNIANVKIILKELVKLIQEKDYSVSRCHQALKETVTILIKYLNDVNLNIEKEYILKKI